MKVVGYHLCRSKAKGKQNKKKCLEIIKRKKETQPTEQKPPKKSPSHFKAENTIIPPKVFPAAEA